MKDLILHVGSNKTGTTSIQYFMSKNRERLFDLGVYYPEIGITPRGAHHFIASAVRKVPHPVFVNEKPVQGYLDEVCIKAEVARCTVLSSEMLFDEKSIVPDELEKILSHFDSVQVIVYLRRQDQYAESFYNSRVRTGAKGTDLMAFAESIDMDYYARLEFWSQFSNVTVGARVFEKKRLKNSDLIHDFVSILKIGNLNAFDAVLPTLNESVNYLAVEALREVNEFKGVSQRFRNLVGKFFDDKYPELKSNALSREQRMWLLNKYEKSNKRLGENYFNESGSPFFDVVADDISQNLVLEKSDFIELMIFLYNEK